MKRYKGPPMNLTINNPEEVPTLSNELFIYIEMKALIEEEIARRRSEAKFFDLEVEFKDGSTRVYPMVDNWSHEDGLMTISTTLYKEEPKPHIGRMSNRLVVIFPRDTLATLNMSDVRGWKVI